MRKNNLVDKELGIKKCSTCGETKPLEEFYPRPNGYTCPACKVCTRQKVSEWRKNNPDRRAEWHRQWVANNPERHTAIRRNAHYKRRYGISRATVLEIATRQDFMCAVCDKEVSEDTLCVDHCHGSGAIRGVLCNQCNIWLAPIENASFLNKALAYLERHRNAG